MNSNRLKKIGLPLLPLLLLPLLAHSQFTDLTSHVEPWQTAAVMTYDIDYESGTWAFVSSFETLFPRGDACPGARAPVGPQGIDRAGLHSIYYQTLAPSVLELPPKTAFILLTRRAVRSGRNAKPDSRTLRKPYA